MIKSLPQESTSIMNYVAESNDVARVEELMDWQPAPGR